VGRGLHPTAKARARRLLAQHNYLGDVHAVGEPLGYAITDDHHQWLGVLVFCAASRRLRAPDPWIGCSEEQPRRRLPLLATNCRFLPLPDKTFPISPRARCGCVSTGSATMGRRATSIRF